MRKIIIASTAFSLICYMGFGQSTVPGSSPTSSSPTSSSPTSSSPTTPSPSSSSPTNSTPTSTTPASSNKNAPTNKPISPSTTPTSGSTSHYANGADKNFHFGISITPGLFWASAGTTNNEGNGVGLGFAFGVNLEFYFTQNYGFVTGLGLANIPSNFTTSYSTTAGKLDSSIKHSYAMQYVEIPLLLKFRTQPIGLFRYFAIAGFNPGIRTSAKDTYTVSGGTGANLTGENINSQTSIIRLSYVFGAGVEYNIAGTTSLQGYVSYDAGFLNVNTGSSSNITSRGITLTIGVLF